MVCVLLGAGRKAGDVASRGLAWQGSRETGFGPEIWAVRGPQGSDNSTFFRFLPGGVHTKTARGPCDPIY